MLSLKCSIIVFLLSILINFQIANAASFNENLKEVRSEINRDNLNEAIKRLKKVKISNDLEQDKINLLYGDIYFKINKPLKAEEFYEKSFMSLNAEIESMTMLGLAEVKMLQGDLDQSIVYANQSLSANQNLIRPKIILAIAKTRIGDKDEALEILNSLYSNQKNNADVNLALAGFYSSFDDNEAAIKLLEKFISTHPTSIKALNELGNLYLAIGDSKKAIEYKYKVLKHYEFYKNKYQVKKIKQWILSVDPKYFDKKPKVRTLKPKESKKYEEEEVTNYDEKKPVPHFEEFDFAYDFTGSGFIVSKGNYVITNHHVIKGATKIAVRNGLGKISNATVAAVSKNYDLAILKLDNPYQNKYSIGEKDFTDPEAGMDVISIGYPMTGFFGNDKPVITQGIISKVYDDKAGIFLTTTNINSGNSGGPIFNLNGKLVGVSVAALDKKKIMDETGNIPTSMGIAIKSNMIKEVFEHKRSVPVSRAKFDKSTIYKKMLPSVVFIAVQAEEE